MKLCIFGSRDFKDYDRLKLEVDGYIKTFPEVVDVEVVSGTARGADTLGERYARENGYSIHRFPARWKKFGKTAGVIRNREMALYADVFIGFWDGNSSGTKSMIDIVHQMGKPLRVVRFSLGAGEK